MVARDDVNLVAILGEPGREAVDVAAQASDDAGRILPGEDEGSHRVCVGVRVILTRVLPRSKSDRQPALGPVPGAKSTGGAPARATASSISKYCSAVNLNDPAMMFDGND
jgi:hypothetical protein